MNLKFAAIVSDPPWKFKTYSEKGLGRSAEAHYHCMNFADIAALPVEEWAAKDSVLFLWVTDPFLPKGLELLSEWGFEYKTVAFYWTKTRKNRPTTFLQPRNFPYGTGYWTRANPEICLLGTRGKPKRVSKDVAKLIIAPRREHSRKPDDIYERVERLVPGPYLDMFSREDRAGWATWGDEEGLFNKAPRECG